MCRKAVYLTANSTSMDPDVLIQIWISYLVFQVPHLQMGAVFLPLDSHEDELLEHMGSAIVLGAIVDGSQIGIPVKQPTK